MQPTVPAGAPPPIDDDERAFRAAFGRMVEWYRVEQSRALWRAFWPGALVLLPLGSALVAFAMLDRFVPLPLQPVLTLLGIAVTAAGPLWAIAVLLRSIRSDLYVAIRIDGLCVRLDPAHPERVCGWDMITDARYDEATGRVAVALVEGEPLSIAGPFSEVDLPELARRIRDARRLAVWNRLKPRFQCSEADD